MRDFKLRKRFNAFVKGGSGGDGAIGVEAKKHGASGNIHTRINGTEQPTIEVKNNEKDNSHK